MSKMDAKEAKKHDKKLDHMPKQSTDNRKLKKLFGFDLIDLSSWQNFVKLMNRPEDPSSLALFRIIFGILMMIDIPNERGMTQADLEYGSKTECNFPLFDFLQPLPVEWMVLVYAIMFIGAFGITLGFKYRLSCLLFCIPYWYLFFLDKTTWNNHSYLYGLIGLQLLIYDANRYLSIDGLLDRSIQNVHVPLWNYCILRAQVFLVYFIAGLKKLDFDWIAGYSMSNLSSHWVFDPFKVILTNDQITLFIVHGGGLFIDLFVGYMLFFDKTRLLGTIISTSFHVMNSRMFNIGMFPYTMLGTTTIFYSNDWPKRLFCKLKLKNEPRDGQDGKFIISKLSPHCIYDKTEKECDGEKKKRSSPKASFYHQFFTIFTIVYLVEQGFMPYSHFITKGYNNWTNGLYGYSWDMMVHSWHTQHIKIHFVDKKTNETHYLNPKAWTTRRRWSSHGDMIYQYANCIKERLNEHGFNDIELYIDVWRSMNHRFNQRQLDPRVDLTRAKWSPFEQTKWLIPLMTELTDWRVKMKEIENYFAQKNREFDLTFVADLPGLKLENYVADSLNTSIEVLKGQVNLETEQHEEKLNSKNKTTLKKFYKNFTLSVGDKMQMPSGTYHNVYTISSEPSCFFYIYTNETAIFISDMYENFSKNMMFFYNQTYQKLIDDKLQENAENTRETVLNDEELIWKAYNQTLMENSKNFLKMISLNRSDESNQNVNESIQNVLKIFNDRNYNQTKIYYDFVRQFYNHFEHKIVRSSQSLLVKFQNKFTTDLRRFYHSFKMVILAFKSIILNKDFVKLVNAEIYNDTGIDS